MACAIQFMGGETMQMARHTIDVRKHAQDVIAIASWHLCRRKWRKRRAMLLGGVQSVAHEVFLSMLKKPPPEEIRLSTAVVKATDWTLSRLWQMFDRIESKREQFRPRGQFQQYASEIDQHADQVDRIRQTLKGLTYRERAIIEMRYGLRDGHEYTMKQTGQVFKLSQERVRQIESKALKKLQHESRSDRLKSLVDVGEKYVPMVCQCGHDIDDHATATQGRAFLFCEHPGCECGDFRKVTNENRISTDRNSGHRSDCQRG